MRHPTRNLRVRYIIGLSMIASLTIIAQVLIQVQIVNQRADADIVNIAGRQRMLSQRLTKEALILQQYPNDENVRGSLVTTLDLWERSHRGLQAGDPDMGLPGENSATVSAMFDEIDHNFEAIVQAAYCLITRESVTASICGTYEQSINLILANEGAFLPGMDRIVFQYADEAQARIQRLRVTEALLATLTLVVLVLEIFLIFRPAERQIHRTLDQLEQAQSDLKTTNNALEARVRERTQQLAQVNNQLQRSNDDLLTFTRVLSHDLKSPVASIKGFISELKMDWMILQPQVERITGKGDEIDYILSESIPDALQSLEKSTLKIENLLMSIGKLSRDGRRNLNIQPQLVRELVEGVLEDHKRDILACNIGVDLQELPDIHADQLTLERTFDNLISNAIKYTDPQRVPEIRIYGESHPDYVTYYVQDNGVGIAAKDRDQVFELFRRVGETTHVEGEGIGLYAIRTMLQRHGGTLDFRSTVGEGSTFYFTLPKNHTFEVIHA